MSFQKSEQTVFGGENRNRLNGFERKSKCYRQSEYEVLSVEQVFCQMNELIEKVSAFAGLASHVIRKLLKRFNWDSQRVLEELCEEQNRLNVLKKSGIFVTDECLESIEPKRRKLSESDDHLLECQICCEQEVQSRMFAMECNHLFCRNCWHKYLITRIVSEGNAYYMTCAQTNCEVIVDDEDVEQLLKEQTVRDRYRKVVINSYVESNPCLRWCPERDCGRVLRVESVLTRAVVCVCGKKWCFGCGQDSHQPLDCNLLKKWNQRMHGKDGKHLDLNTVQWIASNTKECPKCHTDIEKNGGCNHMTCRLTSCKYEFCWICLDSWPSHRDYYSCNRFDPNRVKASQSDQRRDLDKYLFYSNRFQSFEQSLKFEKQLQSNIETKMIGLQSKCGLNWTQLEFLEDAVQVLCDCRQTLMYGFVFEYYCVKSVQLEIFEDNRNRLQTEIEKLSQFIERQFNTHFKQNIKQEVIDLTALCAKRMHDLVEHISEGYQNHWWSFNHH